jgi:hypothetical protein
MSITFVYICIQGKQFKSYNSNCFSAGILAQVILQTMSFGACAQPVIQQRQGMQICRLIGALRLAMLGVVYEPICLSIPLNTGTSMRIMIKLWHETWYLYWFGYSLGQPIGVPHNNYQHFQANSWTVIKIKIRPLPLNLFKATTKNFRAFDPEYCGLLPLLPCKLWICQQGHNEIPLSEMMDRYRH